MIDIVLECLRLYLQNTFVLDELKSLRLYLQNTFVLDELKRGEPFELSSFLYATSVAGPLSDEISQ